METTYSLAFMPDTAIIEKVKSMKLDLANKIGWFHSKNALAHITITEFTIDDSAWVDLEKRVSSTVATFSPFNVKLNAFDYYPNGAFYIAPDSESIKVLMTTMKSLTVSLPIKKQHKSNAPHLSIARKLTPEQLQIAIDMFTSINEAFYCDAIFLRRFNPEIKQFDVIKSFPFRNEFPSTGVQTSLF